MDIKNIPILKNPYYKGKNFCSNPVVKFGIPKYADASLDKSVIGTPDYLKYWEEQIYYIHNGIQTGGLHIPGRYYYFMNFSTFSTVSGVLTPDMCDLHLELAYLIDYAKKNGKNVMAAKGRRKGISEFTQKAVVDYGYRFNYGYQAGIAAGLKDYAEDFAQKWKDSDNLIQPEFRKNTLLRNDDEIIAGYKYKENGQTLEGGNGSKIYIRTMHTNPNMFKGLYLNDVVAEECGEFDKLKEFYSATKACLTKGNKQIGTMFAYGTGGNINKGSKDFKEMWHEADFYNFIKFLIPATRFYFPFYGGASENNVKDVGETPYLLHNEEKKPYQLIGCEDEKAARENILKEREHKKKGPLKDYLEELQNFPLTEEEIFRKTFSNNFDVERLNDQQEKIAMLPNKKYTKYKLTWVLNEKGVRTGKVIAEIPEFGYDEEQCVYILDGYHPLKGFQGLYIAGIDAYDQNKAKSSKSLGAMAVGLRKNGLPKFQNHLEMYETSPVAIYCARPKYKEMFFDTCLKLSVYYDTIGATLGDKAASSGIINHYKTSGFERMLALRPTKFESQNTEQAHEYWVSLNKYSRPMMVGLMQTNIDYNCQNTWFDELLKQLSNFDDVEEGSDNDLADAWGIALMQDVSTSFSPRDNNVALKANPFVLPEWEEGRDGIMTPKYATERPSNPEKDFDGFGYT